jgi:integrase
VNLLCEELGGEVKVSRLRRGNNTPGGALCQRLHEVRAGFNKEVIYGCAKGCRISDVRFHDLRHRHGSRLEDLGFSLAKIGAQPGHTQMQLRYGMLTEIS